MGKIVPETQAGLWLAQNGGMRTQPTPETSIQMLILPWCRCFQNTVFSQLLATYGHTTLTTTSNNNNNTKQFDIVLFRFTKWLKLVIPLLHLRMLLKVFPCACQFTLRYFGPGLRMYYFSGASEIRSVLVGPGFSFATLRWPVFLWDDFLEFYFWGIP